jgi:hypothetical protein
MPSPVTVASGYQTAAKGLIDARRMAFETCVAPKCPGVRCTDQHDFTVLFNQSDGAQPPGCSFVFQVSNPSDKSTFVARSEQCSELTRLDRVSVVCFHCREVSRSLIKRLKNRDTVLLFGLSESSIHTRKCSLTDVEQVLTEVCIRLKV